MGKQVALKLDPTINGSYMLTFLDESICDTSESVPTSRWPHKNRPAATLKIPAYSLFTFVEI
jgi:hypothetical protein